MGLQFLEACENSDILNVMSLVATIVKILRSVIAVGLILMGTIDMGKAVIAGDEKKIKEAQKPFIKRLISAILVFLIPTILSLTMNLVTTDNSYANCWNAAWDNGFTKYDANGKINSNSKNER